jgi:hypothetical protein
MTLGLLIIIVIAVLFFRRMLIRLVLGLFLAAIAYNAIMSQVQAGVESATSVPAQLMAMVQNKIRSFFSEGRKIMEPLVNAAPEGVELYEYCLADVTFLQNNIKPSACEAMPRGQERTACFENQVNTLRSIDGIGDLTQIDDLRSLVRNQCNARFNVIDAMPKLLDAGVRGVGQLYGYCQVPGACEQSTFDNVPYRACLSQKFSAPKPDGLALSRSYCTVYSASFETREQWRKCVEVSMIQQTASRVDLALVPNDTRVPGVQAIRACRQL